MTHISGHDRSQMFLLPEAVDDYVGVDNPVRFIDAFVDGLDLLRRPGLPASKPKARRAAPAMCWRTCSGSSTSTATSKRVRSSRRLEGRDASQYRGDLAAAAPEAGLQDHRHSGVTTGLAFKLVFRQFVLLDHYGRELLAVDGTRIKAVNNKDRNLANSDPRRKISSRAADERLNDYLRRLDEGDVEEVGTGVGAIRPWSISRRTWIGPSRTALGSSASIWPSNPWLSLKIRP